MDDTLQLARSDTYAKLTPSDLETMGKTASSQFLCGGVALDDSIIKLAKEHPSISPHQVRRVVEYANQETFAQLFEKQAGDKNVEFDVADPGAVLHALDLGARPTEFHGSCSDYGESPTKMAHSDVEADQALTQMFLGTDFVSPGSEYTSAVLMKKAEDGTLFVDRILDTGDLEKGSAVDRILRAGEESAVADSGATLSQDMIPDAGAEETSQEAALKEAMGPPGMMLGAGQTPTQHPELTHRENMRGMERRVELEKKKQELVAMQAKGMQAPGDMGGAPGQQQQGAAQQQPAQPGAVQGAPAAEAAPMAPAMPQKMASDLTKQAMTYVKQGRAQAEVVLDDLREGVSLDRIKEAISQQGGYPEANPFGDLIRTQQKVAMLCGEIGSAKDSNAFMMKEAQDEFHHHATQHMLEGGNLGPIVHLMDQVSNDHVITKTSSESLVNHLMTKGLDVDKTRANMITYEMEKSASDRQLNPESSMVKSFASYIKLAGEQPVLEHAHQDLLVKQAELEKALQEAMRSASSIQ